MTCVEFIQWISIGAVGGAAAGLMVWAGQLLRDEYLIWRDKKRIYKWLSSAIGAQGAYLWRSNKTIASYTNLPEDKVRFICSIHKNICQSTGEKDVWGIWGFSRIKSKDDV